MKLNLGCGNGYLEGYVNIDISPKSRADMLVDLEHFPWPFRDNSVSEIHAWAVLEHLENLPGVMEEMARICKHGAKIKIMVPYYNIRLNMGNPYHKTQFSEHTFYFFEKGHPLSRSASNTKGVAFRVISQKLIYAEGWKDKTPEQQLIARRDMADIVEAIHTTLEVDKG